MVGRPFAVLSVERGKVRYVDTLLISNELNDQNNRLFWRGKEKKGEKKNCL